MCYKGLGRDRMSYDRMCYMIDSVLCSSMFFDSLFLPVHVKPLLPV